MTTFLGFGVSVLFLFCVDLWFILRGASCFKVLPCSLALCFYIHFSIVITSLGEEGAGLCASRALVCLFRTCSFLLFFLFPLVSGVSGVGCGLRLWPSLYVSINLYSSYFVCSYYLCLIMSFTGECFILSVILH